MEGGKVEGTITKRKHEFLFNTGSRRLIYPLDTTFIHDLDFNLASKWVEAGWDLQKTNLLEINSFTIPGNQATTSFPSKLFAALIYAWSNNVYFRVVVFSKGFFDDQTNLLLKINAWHEKQHLVNFEEHLHCGARVLSEDDIVRKEVEYVLRTFGKNGFKARGDEVRAFRQKFESSDAIPGFPAIIFVREYIERNYQKYAHNALPIPSNEYAETLCHVNDEAALNLIETYDALDEDVSEIFKYTLQDINRT